MPPQAKSKPAAEEAAIEQEAPPAAEEVKIQHPQYGEVTLAELEDILKAEITSKMVADMEAQAAAEAAKLPELCSICFPDGWESSNAAGQDGVGCEHGSWNRKAPKE